MAEMQELCPEQDLIQLADSQARKMIIAIKKARIEKRLSYQAIVDGCEKNGDFVSMSTVRRVCAEGSENQRFRYEATLRPIARFVLGLDEDVPVAQAATEDGPAANELLRVVVGIKEDAIEGMRQDIQEHEAEIAQIREEAATRLQEKERSINHLNEELKERKQDIAQMRAEIQQLKKGRIIRTIAIIALSALLLLCMATAVVYLAAK